MTATVREMILKALDDVGGQEWLVKQATANPTAFMGLLAKILPTQVQAEVTGDLTVGIIEKVIIDPAGNGKEGDQD